MYDDYVMDGGYIYKSQAGVWDEAHVAKIWGASTSFWQPSAVAMYGDYAILAFMEYGQALQDKRVFIYQKETFGDGSVAWGPNPYNGNSITYGVGQANAPVAVIEGYTDQGAFGYSLSMYGDYLVVGAPGANKAFIFGMTDGAWDTTAVAILDGSAAGATKGFGASVAIHGNQIIVGSASYYYYSSTGQYTKGYGDQKAYVFEKLDDGWSTDPYTTLEMPTNVCGCGIGAATTEDFGINVAIDGTNAIVSGEQWGFLF